jgi:hypothetical protein
MDNFCGSKVEFFALFHMDGRSIATTIALRQLDYQHTVEEYGERRQKGKIGIISPHIENVRYHAITKRPLTRVG